jgi:hypothetical protein
VVTVTDMAPGTGSGAVVTAAVTGGSISGYTIVSGGTNYSNPVLTITDAGNGTGANVAATISVTNITLN